MFTNLKRNDTTRKLNNKSDRMLKKIVRGQHDLQTFISGFPTSCRGDESPYDESPYATNSPTTSGPITNCLSTNGPSPEMLHCSEIHHFRNKTFATWQKTGFEDSEDETMSWLRGKSRLGTKLLSKRCHNKNKRDSLEEPNLGQCRSIEPTRSRFLPCSMEWPARLSTCLYIFLAEPPESTIF